MSCPEQAVTLFLDYDGTLHECLHIYAPAFRCAYQALAEQGYAPPQTFTDTQISHWLGYTACQMWNTFLPQLPAAKQAEVSNMIGAQMLEQIQQGQARLYSNAIDILAQLHNQQIQLVLLSNCSHDYLAAHQAYFQLERFFSAFYCIDDYPVFAKWQMYQLVKAQHPGIHIIVGDRWHDLETAQRFACPSIGCRYGYGAAEELQSATYVIDAITELPEAVQKILNNRFTRNRCTRHVSL